jgi:heme-degrading monooxygenase HmoA
MIACYWRGWTKLQNAETYEALLKDKALPGLKSIAGYRGGYVLRNDGPQESEFVVVNLFDSLDSVREFAGPDYAVAVFEPEAKRLLSKFEPKAVPMRSGLIRRLGHPSRPRSCRALLDCRAWMPAPTCFVLS